MGGAIHQRPVVMLAMDFDDLAADPGQQRRRDRLVIDEGAGAAIGKLHAAQDDVFVIGYGIVAQGSAGRMIGGQSQHGHHLPALLAAAHQRGIAAPAQRQGQCIEQNGLAGAGLAGQHGHAAVKRQVKLVDQDDVANRERVEHARCHPRLRGRWLKARPLRQAR